MSTERFRMRWIAAMLIAAATTWAAPLPAARLVLATDDGPNEGFNDPTPVPRVLGNSATTLGGQRTRVFEAAAWRLGTMIASPVEIRVEAGWESLGCTLTTGRLAQASPAFVFRDFPGAARPGTWYGAALAKALAGDDLGSAGEVDMRITFNSDLTGDPSCLRGRRWDYRIGASPAANFSMETVMVHEMSHGLNFTEFTDDETGEKFQGFDDAYMVHLEDHATGKRWPAMTNAERRASRIRTGMLHWLGANAQAFAIRLRGGVHGPSGHPQMFAPNPARGGSSVSHWDPAIEANVSELMEPFYTRSSTPMLTRHLFQDLGWPVNRFATGWVEDQNGNGSIEIAVLQISEGLGEHEVVLLDSSSGIIVRRIPLPAGYSALDLVVVPHHSGPPASEIAVLLWRAQGSAVQVVQLDASTGEEVQRFSFPSGAPMRLLAVPDYAGSTAAELLVFGVANGTGARVWVKDAATGMFLRRINFANPERPVDVAVLDSFAGSPAPEIALLLAIPKQGRSEIRVRDGRTGAQFARIGLPEGRVYHHLTALRDFAGAVGVGELAMVSLDVEGGTPRLLVVDGRTGETLSEREFREAFVPTSLDTLPSFGATMADELLLWTRRPGGLRPRGHVLDAGSMANLGTPVLPDKQLPRAIALLPNIGRSPAIDAVVLAGAPRDRRQRAFLFDGRGSQIRSLVLP